MAERAMHLPQRWFNLVRGRCARLLLIWGLLTTAAPLAAIEAADPEFAAEGIAAEGFADGLPPPLVLSQDDNAPPPAVTATAEPGGVPDFELSGERAVDQFPGDLPEFQSNGDNAAEDGFPLRGRFDEGFELQSIDRQFQLRFRVLNQIDGKVFDPTSQEPARSGMYIPRFRIYFEGQLTDAFEYELSLQRSVEGAFDVLDANVNFVASEALQVRVGRALVPYSFSWYDHLEQYYITPERGLFPLNYGLARQAGVFAHGKVLDERLQYAIGGTFGQLSGLADTNTTRDGVGYVNARPFLHSDTCPALRFLNIGGSLSIGRQVDASAPLPLRTSIQTSENDEAAQAASSIFLEFADATVARGERAQGALHLACYSGPLSLEAEAFAARFGFAANPAAPEVGVPILGYDVTLAGFLTGESVEDRTKVAPLCPVTFRTGSGGGAVELFGRFSKLRLGDQVFSNGLADAADWTNSAAITDIGVNWYLNRFARLTFDWQHSMYAKPVLLNASQDLRSQHNNLYWLRCQLYF